MLLECRNCGAPLDIEVGKPTAKCRYCRATSRTDSLRTVAPTTPPGWRPPPVWVPPTHMEAASVPLQYTADTRASVGVAIGMMLLFSTLGISVILLSTRYSSTSPGATAWHGTTALICMKNEQLSFSDLNASFAEGGSIIASGRCQITLTRCNLASQSPIILRDDALLRIVGGRVRATDSGVAIAAMDHSSVALEDGATATGTIAVVAVGRAIIDASHGSLVGIVTLDGDARVLQSPAASSISATPPEPPNAAPPKAPTRPRAPPASAQTAPTPGPGPCGCRAGDLMCAMKCSNSK